MAKRTPRSVKKSCDSLFSLLIRKKGACERCGRDGSQVQLHCAHIYSRKFGSVRFDEMNALCLCAGCHRWGHDNPPDFIDLVYQKRGQKNMNELQARKIVITKRKLHDWLELEEELKNKLNG